MSCLSLMSERRPRAAPPPCAAPPPPPPAAPPPPRFKPAPPPPLPLFWMERLPVCLVLAPALPALPSDLLPVGPLPILRFPPAPAPAPAPPPRFERLPPPGCNTCWPPEPRPFSWVPLRALLPPNFAATLGLL